MQVASNRNWRARLMSNSGCSTADIMTMNQLSETGSFHCNRQDYRLVRLLRECACDACHCLY